MLKLVAMLQSAPPAAAPAAGADEPMLEKMDFYHVGAASASEAEVYLLALLLISTGLCDDELNNWAAVVVEIGAQYKDQAELWRPPTAKGEATRWARPQLQMASAAKAGKRALSRAGEALGKLLPDVGAPSESSLLTWSGGINRAPNRRPLNGPEDGSKHPLRRHIHAMVPVANLLQRDLALLRQEYDAATGVLFKSKTPTKAELLEAAEAAAEVAEKSQRAGVAGHPDAQDLGVLGVLPRGRLEAAHLDRGQGHHRRGWRESQAHQGLQEAAPAQCRLLGVGG